MLELLYHKRYLLITTVVDGNIFDDEIVIDTKHRFYTEEKLFEFKYSAKCRNLFKYFVSHMRNAFPTPEQIKLQMNVVTCLLFAFCYFWFCKKYYKTFAQSRNGWCWKWSINMFLKS